MWTCITFSGRNEEEARENAAKRFHVSKEKIQLKQGEKIAVMLQCLILAYILTIPVQFERGKKLALNSTVPDLL